MCERKIQSLVQTLHSARHPHSALQVAYDTQNTGVRTLMSHALNTHVITIRVVKKRRFKGYHQTVACY